MTTRLFHARPRNGQSGRPRAPRKPALDSIGRVKTEAAALASAGGTPLDTAKLARSQARRRADGAVYKITVGRDDLGMKEHGAVINARMGLNTWAAFVGTQEDAAIAVTSRCSKAR